MDLVAITSLTGIADGPGLINPGLRNGHFAYTLFGGESVGIPPHNIVYIFLPSSTNNNPPGRQTVPVTVVDIFKGNKNLHTRCNGVVLFIVFVFRVSTLFPTWLNRYSAEVVRTTT